MTEYNWSELDRDELTARIWLLLEEKNRLQCDKNMVLEKLSNAIADNISLKADNKNLRSKAVEMAARTQRGPRLTRDQLRAILRPERRPTDDASATNADVFNQQEDQKLKAQSSTFSTEAANAKQEAQESEQEKNALCAQQDKPSGELNSDFAVQHLCSYLDGLTTTFANPFAKKLYHQRPLPRLFHPVNSPKGTLELQNNFSEWRDNDTLYQTIGELRQELIVERAQTFRLNMSVESQERCCDSLRRDIKNLEALRKIDIRDAAAASKRVERSYAACTELKMLYEQQQKSAVARAVEVARKDVLEHARAESRAQASRIDELERALSTANQAAQERATMSVSMVVVESKLQRTKRRLKASEERVEDLSLTVERLESRLALANSVNDQLTTGVEEYKESAHRAERKLSAIRSFFIAAAKSKIR